MSDGQLGLVCPKEIELNKPTSDGGGPPSPSRPLSQVRKVQKEQIGLSGLSGPTGLAAPGLAGFVKRGKPENGAAGRHLF